MKKTLLSLSLGLLSLETMAQSFDFANSDWAEVTTLEDLNQKVSSRQYYFVFTHASSDAKDNTLMWRMVDGYGSKRPCYYDVCDPATDLSRVWIVESNHARSSFADKDTETLNDDNYNFSFRNASHTKYCMQAETGKSNYWYIYTNNQYRSGMDNGRFGEYASWIFTLDAGAWNIAAAVKNNYPTDAITNWVGYDSGANIAEGETSATGEIYTNKDVTRKSNLHIYCIQRSAYVSSYLAGDKAGVDLTWLIDNNDVTWGTIDWQGTTTGKSWDAFAVQTGNTNFDGRFFEMWGGNGLTRVLHELTQNIGTLPTGKYTLTAKTTLRNDDASLIARNTADGSAIGSEAIAQSENSQTTTLTFCVNAAAPVAIGISIPDQDESGNTWCAADDFTLSYVSPLSHTVAFASAVEGYATLCLPFQSNIPEGVEAYKASAPDQDGFVTLTAIDTRVLPAGEPVLLKGNAGESATFTANHDATLPRIADNKFAGNSTDAEVAVATLGIDLCFTLGLGSTSGKVGFYRYTGANIGAYKAYYPAGNGNAVRGFMGLDNEGQATAIASAQTSADNAVVFDLQGRRVTNAKRGVYVINGKKILK